MQNYKIAWIRHRVHYVGLYGNRREIEAMHQLSDREAAILLAAYSLT